MGDSKVNELDRPTICRINHIVGLQVAVYDSFMVHCKSELTVSGYEWLNHSKDIQYSKPSTTSLIIRSV